MAGAGIVASWDTETGQYYFSSPDQDGAGRAGRGEGRRAGARKISLQPQGIKYRRAEGP